MELYQIGDDIWWTDKPVLPHTDSTAENMLTYGLILVNTGYRLNYDGIRIEIPAGSVYEIDARKPHSTEGSGYLAALIWDMPDWSPEIFIREIQKDPRFQKYSRSMSIAFRLNP